MAIGDVHGDLEATRTSLRVAGAIDKSDHWSVGKLVLVQVGDQLDRGNQEKSLLSLFDQKEHKAARAGGAFLVLDGDHEPINVLGDYR